MKKIYLSIVLIFVLSMSACGGDTDAESTEEDTLSGIYTAAAMTLAAQDSLATPTFTLMPSKTPTLWASPTTQAGTATSQNVTTYSSSSSYSTAYGCYDAVYVSDVTIADGTVLAPSDEFTKTWKLQNAGSCDWTEDFLITFSSGEDMDGDDTEIDEAVTAGDTASISVSLVAPDDEGSYTGYWKMATEDGTLFGESVYVLIVVSDDASTSTPTSTATSTSTSSTSTPTATSTSTPTPTSTTASSYSNE